MLQLCISVLIYRLLKSELYSLPLLPPGLRCVVQLVRLVRQDDIAVVHYSSPPADQWDGGVIGVGTQGHGAPAWANPKAAATSTDEGHLLVLVHPHVIHGVIVGGIGAHAAPTDWGRGAAQRPVEALRGGRAGRHLGPHHRAAMFLIEGGQHGAGGGGDRRKGESGDAGFLADYTQRRSSTPSRLHLWSHVSR